MSLRKFKYYTSNALLSLIPYACQRYFAQMMIRSYASNPSEYIDGRVNYYNKLHTKFELPETESTRVSEFKKTGGNTYYFDLKKVIKGFLPGERFAYLNGDIRTIPEYPTFLKSRPIEGDNANSVVLKLNEIRHFNFINDEIPFEDKLDKVVWRGVGYQPHRQVVIHNFYDHPMCNIGQTKPQKGDPWEKGFVSIEEQLKYKFILAIEGNDVATNLKWAMSSNSLVIMSKPRYETWFMEGRLEPGKHYVQVKADYSDLIEKVEYYLANPDEAKAIINNANLWTEQFKDKKQEKLISLLVADKYFNLNTTPEM
ncbi:glycosyl transferase family 90 [Vibrio astriarenae]|uniref:glycosyl transferase family 90 n=1 Tax=Vibrio astriarenae TaxID=1481923 RepID=UPI0037356181